MAFGASFRSSRSSVLRRLLRGVKAEAGAAWLLNLDLEALDTGDSGYIPSGLPEKGGWSRYSIVIIVRYGIWPQFYGSFGPSAPCECCRNY